MGTWDIGPFENDMAADFAYTLDETTQDKREERVRATLIRTIQALDHLKSPEGAEAVAAAALIAAQCPGGPRPRVWWPSSRPATARRWAAPGAAPYPKRCQEASCWKCSLGEEGLMCCSFTVPRVPHHSTVRRPTAQRCR
ncbi:DUF4259 domain-containing protein [Streptomyces sp. NPDC056323]|uniref:DUF4259 domain-containing protein n=1 Tax=unclassified Streptomyces TaxID=2593676 RepID=UPI0035E28E37